MSAPGDSPSRRSGLVVEYLFAAAIVAALIALIRFVGLNGYFPDPFFNDTTDTFMDWYNTAYWAHHGGAFEFWGSVYPPAALFFVKVFSLKACYAVSSEIGRSCDRTGVTLLTSLLFVNTYLTWRVLRKAGIAGAIPRAVALGFGAPILLAWERGNEIVPCYTVFILAYGRLLKSGWLRMLCAAVSVNFKPYLIVLAIAPLIKRRWRWLEGFGLCLAVVYALGYFAMGEGDPIHLLQDIGGFSETSPNPPVNILRFAVTYRELLQILNSDYPLMYFLGSKPMDMANAIFPPLMQLGGAGALACLAAAGLKREALTVNTLSAPDHVPVVHGQRPGGLCAELPVVLHLRGTPVRRAGLGRAGVRLPVVHSRRHPGGDPHPPGHPQLHQRSAGVLRPASDRRTIRPARHLPGDGVRPDRLVAAAALSPRRCGGGRSLLGGRGRRPGAGVTAAASAGYIRASIPTVLKGETKNRRRRRIRQRRARKPCRVNPRKASAAAIWSGASRSR